MKGNTKLKKIVKISEILETVAKFEKLLQMLNEQRDEYSSLIKSLGETNSTANIDRIVDVMNQNVKYLDEKISTLNYCVNYIKKVMEKYGVIFEDYNRYLGNYLNEIGG